MNYGEYLYELFFEISSQERHKILKILQDETENLTNLSKKTGLNLPETRRHISRLLKVDLIERIPDGRYNLTAFGKQILETIEEIAFVSQFRDYFLTHSVSQIPREYQIKLRDLSKSEYNDNIMTFIRKLEKVIKEAEKEVLLLVEQFPLNHLSIIMAAIERGVVFKIIEPIERTLNPDLEALAPQDSLTLERIKLTPQVEQRMIDKINIFLVVSENDAVLAFPTIEGEYDYKGFRAMDKHALEWCKGLFDHVWEKASVRKEISKLSILAEKNLDDQGLIVGKIVLSGSDRPEIDAPAIQNAVDRYDEVVLKGRFNIGKSMINIKRSVILRGESRTNGVPDASLYKYGWDFPFLNQDFLLLIGGEGIDVTVENIHFDNFNGTCINTHRGNSVKIRDNRITLLSGLGRGLSMGKWGDHVVGITAGGDNVHGGFPGGILVENNYLDFALSYVRGGFITKDGSERNPAYRPDLQNHEVPICIGINICRNLGSVIVRNNMVRNMNSRGILVFDNRESADILIDNNQITSEVYGAYPYNNQIAGVAVFIQSAWSEPRRGGRIRVLNNKIKLEKINYCGIAVHGPAMYSEGAGKIGECIIENNEIQLDDGMYCLQLRKSDNVKIRMNRISGRAYYGLQVSGSRSKENFDLRSNNNVFYDNDLDELEIKPSDEYGHNNVGDYIFSGVDTKSVTAHVWLNRYSSNNLINLSTSLVVVDEGEDNIITRI